MQEQSPATAPRSDGVLDWSELPESVRVATIDAAARVLGALRPGELPAALLPIARFTPARRAKRGAVSIAKEIRDNAGFRAAVASRLPAGFGAGRDDPIRACARAYLVRLPGGADLLGEVAAIDELTALRAEVTRLTDTVDHLVARLATAEAVPVVPQPAAEAAAAASETDARVEKLRHRLREQGSRTRASLDEAERDRLAAIAQRDEAIENRERDRALAVSWQRKAELEARRADAAGEALERARGAASQARMDRDRRMELLLDTVIGAASGLRREWHLATGGADPAEVVARDLARPGPHPARPVDAALLLQWLQLPGAHMIIDGYNVTKTGYPHLALAEQRDRLVRSLGALAARTKAEVTVVFDGAAVVAVTPSTSRVRVVFSPPDIIADDVIRDMAAAEPAGRVVVVVTSDREIVDGVRRSGARVAPSAVLLAVLEA